MKAALNADLHCHSTVSDGVLAPSEVAARAHANGVTLWALTDHDELGGQAEAMQAAADLGMRCFSGVEISVTWSGQTVHIVGLDVDTQDATLLEGRRLRGCAAVRRQPGTHQPHAFRALLGRGRVLPGRADGLYALPGR